MSRRTAGDGSLKKRKDGRWEYRVTIDFQRRSFYGKTKKEALEKHKAFLKENKPPLDSVQLVSQWAAFWLENYKKDKVAWNTYSIYRNAINNHIVPKIGHLVLTAVRPAHLTGFTVCKEAIRVTLVSMFNDAIANKLCEWNPAKEMKVVKSKSNHTKIFTETHLKSVMESAPKHEGGKIVQWLLYTGIRISELAALTWDKLDLKQKTLLIDSASAKSGSGYVIGSTKTGSIRVIALSDSFCSIIRQDAKDSGSVFGMNPSQLYKRYVRFFKLSDLPYLSPHKCRHTFASGLLKGGADLRATQTILGHSSLVMTEKYLHVDTADLKRNIDKLPF